MTNTKTLKTSEVVEQQGSIDSGANCIVPLCNERREDIHASTGPNSLALNKNLEEHLGKCNALTKVTPPSLPPLPSPPLPSPPLPSPPLPLPSPSPPLPWKRGVWGPPPKNFEILHCCR